MGLGDLWLRALYARLLISAKNYVAVGEYQAAQRDVVRIFDLYGARGVEVPIHTDIIHALIAWSLGSYDETCLRVRQATDKLGRLLSLERRASVLHELHYLRAYCWTLIYYSEISGGGVVWENFADLAPSCYVNLSKVSRTTREMFPIDKQVFAPARILVA